MTTGCLRPIAGSGEEPLPWRQRSASQSLILLPGMRDPRIYECDQTPRVWKIISTEFNPGRRMPTSDLCSLFFHLFFCVSLVSMPELVEWIEGIWQTKYHKPHQVHHLAALVTSVNCRCSVTFLFPFNAISQQSLLACSRVMISRILCW